MVLNEINQHDLLDFAMAMSCYDDGLQDICYVVAWHGDDDNNVAWHVSRLWDYAGKFWCVAAGSVQGPCGDTGPVMACCWCKSSCSMLQ